MKNSRFGPIGNALTLPSSGEWDELFRTSGLMSARERAAWGRNRAMQLADFERRRCPVSLAVTSTKVSDSQKMEVRFRLAVAMVSRAA